MQYFPKMSIYMNYNPFTVENQYNISLLSPKLNIYISKQKTPRKKYLCYLASLSHKGNTSITFVSCHIHQTIVMHPMKVNEDTFLT